MITGYGAVTTWGSGPGAAWDALAAARSAGRDYRPGGELESFFAAPLAEDLRPHERIPRNLVHFLDGGSLAALNAALQAIDSVGLGPGAGDARRFAVADGLPYRAPGQPAIFVPYGHSVARALGVRGPTTICGGAEASGMAAIASAVRLIAQNEADVVIAGASQALQRPLLEHLQSQSALAGSYAVPFDARHNGCVPAEGAAYVVIESADHARERGATPLATIASVGEVFDPMAEPLAMSDAAEVGRAQQAALANAGYLQNQVDFFLSCADGRPAVDFAEGYGLKRTFGRHTYYASVSTAAASLGHALAASGPLSLVVALEAMRRQQVFPIAGFEKEEEDLDLAYVKEFRAERLDCLLVSSMGVGGTLVAILVERAGAN